MKTTTTKSSPPRPVRAATAASILGSLKQTPVKPPPAEPEVCYVCHAKLSASRITALQSLGTPPLDWTCVKCSNTITTPRLGIFMGEVGTSELRIVDKIYTDSVRDIFMEGSDTKEEED